MASTLDLDSLLNASERKQRRQWLYFFIASIVLGWIVTLATIQSTLDIYRKTYSSPWLVFGGSLAFSFLYQIILYKMAYRQHRTFLLTLTLALVAIGLITTGIGLISLAYMYFSGVLPSSFFYQFIHLQPGLSGGTQLLYLLSSFILAVPYIILTKRLRRVNKVLRCHVNFPEESAEAIRFVRDENGEKGRFAEAAKRWPRLKPLIERERSLRA